MANAKREYSKSEIDKAGTALKTLMRGDPARDYAIEVTNNWRSCHAYPLAVVAQTLRKRARTIDSEAIVAQRLKRLPSIELKLKHNETMKLSQMQDLGGCRAILNSSKELNDLIAIYNSFTPKQNAKSIIEIGNQFDYLNEPKPDGYRGYHIIARYKSESPVLCCYNDQRIEIQIRSRLQHAWATSLEIAQLFTGQALKTKIKTANDDWIRFFALASSAFGIREGFPVTPGTPERKAELINELRYLEEKLKALDTFSGFKIAVSSNVGGDAQSKHRILKLDLSRRQLEIYSFNQQELERARERYQSLEREFDTDPSVNIVFVSIEAYNSLQTAYPNYYVDSSRFINMIRHELT